MITSSRLDYFELFPLNCSFYIHWNYSLAMGWCRCLITWNELVYRQKFILYMNNAVNLRSLVNYVRLQNLTNLNKQIFSDLLISGERELVISCDETASINCMYFFFVTLNMVENKKCKNLAILLFDSWIWNKLSSWKS